MRRRRFVSVMASLTMGATALTALGHPPSNAAAPAGAPIAAAAAAAAADASGPQPPSSRSAPTEQAAEEASTRFKRGLQLFDEGDYTLALVEFERAYQLAPNYRALYNIGLVDVQLARYADAARTFEQYLHDGGDGVPESRRAEVANTLAGLKLRTATVDITLSVPSADVTLDSKPLDPARLHGPLLIDAGEHTLRATAPGFQPAYRTVTLAGADRVSVALSLVPNPVQREAVSERGRTLFWPGFVATGAFAAGAIVSGVVMLEARSSYSQLENAPNASKSQLQSDASQVNSAALAADILTGLAVVSGGVSLYLSLRVDHSPKAPTVGISPQGILLSGSF
jgi:tetratricopeptide (TPR) repeat protein